MLDIVDLSVAYGGLHALSGVSLAVAEGQFVAIVGPNGAGKTTLFKSISGIVAPVSGQITYEGRDLLGLPPWRRAHLGIAHVPEGRRHQLAGTLSGGEQQMLAIGRGIASSPRLLLLDEPSMGLAPAVADLIFDRITALNREDRITLLLVEQRVAEALESCDYGYVLETGRVVLEGRHEALIADDRIRRAYLGM